MSARFYNAKQAHDLKILEGKIAKNRLLFIGIDYVFGSRIWNGTSTSLEKHPWYVRFFKVEQYVHYPPRKSLFTNYVMHI